MEPLTVIEAFQVSKNGRSGLRPRFKMVAIDTFGFERPPLLPWEMLERKLQGNRQNRDIEPIYEQRCRGWPREEALRWSL